MIWKWILEFLAGSAFMVAVGYDIRQHIIPNTCCGLIFAAGVFLRWGIRGEWVFLEALFVGGILLLVGMWCPSSIGGGDIKLCAALAACYGLVETLMAILIGCFELIIIACCRGEQKGYPFAPMLLGGFILLLIGRICFV